MEATQGRVGRQDLDFDSEANQDPLAGLSQGVMRADFAWTAVVGSKWSQCEMMAAEAGGGTAAGDTGSGCSLGRCGAWRAREDVRARIYTSRTTVQRVVGHLDPPVMQVKGPVR